MVKEWVRDTWRWGEPSLNPSIALTWVNGINYTNEEMEEQARFLSSLFGCRVRPYYNPSLGWWLRDLTRVSYMYIRSPTEDPVVTGLARHLSRVLLEVGPKGRVIHLAHSGGALLTYLVAKYHLKETDRRRIDVLNFGGARSITQKYFGKATNYYARNDPILLVNRRAMNLMQQLLNESADGEVIYLKHNTSFVFLQGRAGDALTDHSFIGPTYLMALNKEAAVFRRSYYRPYWLDGLIIAKPPDMGWARFVRKRVAAATGFHNYFSNSTLVRLYYGDPLLDSSTWDSTSRAALHFPKRVRKYLRKKYFSLRGLPYVSAKTDKVNIPVPAKQVQQQQLIQQQLRQEQQRHLKENNRHQERSDRPGWGIDGAATSWSSSLPASLSSWIGRSWRQNNTQALVPVPAPGRNSFSFQWWFKGKGSGVLGRGPGSSRGSPSKAGSLVKFSVESRGWSSALHVSRLAVQDLRIHAQHHIRRVRKRAARWTGRRHFFAGREGRERAMAAEAARTAAALAEAEKAVKGGHPFLFFFGRSKFSEDTQVREDAGLAGMAGRKGLGMGVEGKKGGKERAQPEIVEPKDDVLKKLEGTQRREHEGETKAQDSQGSREPVAVSVNSGAFDTVLPASPQKNGIPEEKDAQGIREVNASEANEGGELEAATEGARASAVSGAGVAAEELRSDSISPETLEEESPGQLPATQEKGVGAGSDSSGQEREDGPEQEQAGAAGGPACAATDGWEECERGKGRRKAVDVCGTSRMDSAPATGGGIIAKGPEVPGGEATRQRVEVRHVEDEESDLPLAAFLERDDAVWEQEGKGEQGGGNGKLEDWRVDRSPVDMSLGKGKARRGGEREGDRRDPGREEEGIDANKSEDGGGSHGCGGCEGQLGRRYLDDC